MTEAEKELYATVLDSRVISRNLKALLQKYKDDNRELIRISGSKSEKIENIFEAVEAGVIELSEVQALIKDSEEYGDQYIYLYTPIEGANLEQINDGESVANSLLPVGIRAQFPKIMQMPDQREWVDFRAPNRGKENSWLVKLYGKKTREVKEDEEFDRETGRRIVTYQRKEDRLVFIAEWDGKEELAVKISRTSFDSPTSLRSSKRGFEQLIAPAVNIPTNFTHFDLSNVINNVLEKWEDNKEIYNLLSAKFIDTLQGHATFSTYGEDELDLLSEQSRKEAINAYLKGDGRACNVVFKLLADGSGDKLSQDLTIILGRDEMNQVIIPSSISPQEYKYVRRKIAEFS
jgi:hypothetical protein